MTDRTVAGIAAEIRSKSDGISFLSEVDLDADSLAFVRAHVDDILRSMTGSEDECVVKAFVLVDIGCRFYQENTYWPQVVNERNRTSRFGHIDYLDQSEKDNYIYSFSRGLDAVGLKHGRVTPRSIEGILIHSFVPDYKMNDFFDFALLFYKRILGFSLDDLDEGLDTLSDFMSEFVAGRISSVDDNVPNPQKLLRCTRYALCDKELFGPFMEKLMDIIDSGYRGVRSSVPCSSRFVKAFDAWFDGYMADKGRKKMRSEYQRRPKLRLSDSGKLLLFVSQRRCQKGDKLIVEWKGCEYVGPQPNYFSLSGSIYAMDYTLNLSQLCDGISAFDGFRVRLGNRSIYDSRRKGRYVLFDDEGFESVDMSEGYNSILLDGDLDISPRELVTYRGNGFVQVCVRNGDVLHIGDDIILVDDPDRPENTIGADSIRGARITAGEDLYPVVSESRIPFNISVPQSSTIVVRISSREFGTRALIIGPDTRHYYRSETRCLFEILLSELLVGPDILSIDVRENDSRSICKSTFAYLPDFHPRFDREYYLEETEGQFLVANGELLSFSTNQDEVCIPFELQNERAILSIDVPSIWLSFDGDSWMPPGIHSYSIVDFRWDCLFVKTKVSNNIRLYSNVPKTELDPEPSSEYTLFNLIGLRNEIENRVYDHQSKYEISISLDSQIRRPLVEINVHNQYVFIEDSGVIEFYDYTGIPAKYILKRNGAVISEGMIFPGSNTIALDSKAGATLSILEQNPYNRRFDVEMFSKILGGDEYIVQEESGFVFVYRNNKMQFSSKPDDVSAVMKEYESKMRFNPWMKKPEVRRSLQNLINPQAEIISNRDRR